MAVAQPVLFAISEVNDYLLISGWGPVTPKNMKVCRDPLSQL